MIGIKKTTSQNPIGDYYEAMQYGRWGVKNEEWIDEFEYIMSIHYDR